MSWLSRLLGREATSPTETEATSPTETREFRIEWACESSAVPQEASDSLLFLSDIERITGSDLTRILNAKAVSEIRRYKGIAFFTPGLHESALSILKRENLIAVRATGLPGQTVSELLQDLAIYTGGVVLSAELGFGLATPDLSVLMGRVQGVEFRPITPDSDQIMTEAGLVVPGNLWDQTSPQLLGRAVRLETGATATSVVGGYCPARTVQDLSRQIQVQWLRSADATRRLGLERRLRRFGVTMEAPRSTEAQSPTVKPGQAAIPLGLASAYFVTDPCALECVLEKGDYLGFDSEVHDVATILPALERAARTGRPLVIAAPKVCGLALACMVSGKLRGVVLCAALCPVRPASSIASMLNAGGRAAVNQSRIVAGEFARIVATSEGAVFS